MEKRMIKFEKELSKDNFEVLKVTIDNKREVYLGSKYNNQKYIENIKDELKKIDMETVILIFGLGTGHILKHIDIKKYRYNNIIFVEPVEEIYNENLKNIKCENLNYVKQQDLIDNISCVIGEKETLKFKFVEFANYASVFEEEYIELYKKINEVVLNARVNIQTEKAFNNILIENYFNNIKNIDKYYSVNQLKNILDKKPAIVVSAGPSLEKNIEILKENKEKFCIITGQRTVRTLIEKGIVPDFVCSVDPQEICFEMVKDIDCTDLRLISYITSNYKMAGKFNEKFIVNDGMFNEFLSKKLDLWIDELYIGGSVSHTCMALADYMGCSPIVFVGQDLAYTGEKYHANIATTEDNNTIDEKTKYILVEDIYGDMVKTDEMLDYYRKNIEKYIKKSDKKFINATEGGANIKGTEVLRLKEVSDVFLDMNKDAINDVLTIENRIKLKNIDFNIEFKSLKDIGNKCNKYFNKLNQIKSDKNINKLFKEITKFIDEIKDNPYIIFFINDIENKIIVDKEYSISYEEDTKDLIKKMKLQLKEFMKELQKLVEKIEKSIDL